MIKEFNSIEDIQKYYDKKTNTYIFKENDNYIDTIKFNFYLYAKSDIKCRNIIGKNITAYNINACNINAYNITAYNINANDINACNINALDIHACNINAGDINARDIDAGNINAYDIEAGFIEAYNICANNINADYIVYSAICFAYKNIKCKSIEGRRPYSEHFVSNGTIEIKEGENEN